MKEVATKRIRPRDLEPGMKVMHWSGVALVPAEVLYVTTKRANRTSTVYLVRTAEVPGIVGEFTRKYTPGTWVEVLA